MRIGAVIRFALVLAFVLIAFMIWLGKVGVALGAVGLAGTVVLAFVRGAVGKRKLEAAMREADAAEPPARPRPYR